MIGPHPGTLPASLSDFSHYAQALKGDEKGEAQLFCDRLFRAFGHEGLQAAGATLESRVKSGSGQTKFADLVWPGKLLIEMKKKGENLQRHYSQAFEYWTRIVPHRPKYVTLCNFDEFWIYDFDNQLDEPMDRVHVRELPQRYDALNFLLPTPKKPLFKNDLIAVTKTAAAKVSHVFNEILGREALSHTKTYDKQTALALARVPVQRFILQCVIAMFSEDAGLLPKGLFTELLEDCRAGQSSYDVLGGLFRQMNSRHPARAGRYAHVPYFNGGLFADIDPIELTSPELHALQEAASENWAKVKPSIFGTLFQSSMGQTDRHAFGAHYTSEADIQKVVLPTIVQPWRERIAATDKLKDLKTLRDDLLGYRVLDPACGSGNFLYVAYRELKRLEMDLLNKVHDNFGPKVRKEFGMQSQVNPRQCFGIDIVPFAVELAKVTLMIGRQLALAEQYEMLKTSQQSLKLDYDFDSALPLDNLDQNILCADALFTDWPAADAIIGNPPFVAKNKMVPELGADYVKRIREAYPEVSGRADLCVYWFRKAHDQLKTNQRAGLVGTNTIRQNFSREGSLDYIIKNQGTIYNAISKQVWTGDAAVHVSIVNWIKGSLNAPKYLSWQEGDNVESPWVSFEVSQISPSLSMELDISEAKKLLGNTQSKICYQGQTHGHAGFLINEEERINVISDKKSFKVVHPYLTGDDLVGIGLPSRYAIDLSPCKDVVDAMFYTNAFKHVERLVLPSIKNNAEKEFQDTNKSTGPRQNHYKGWWKFWRGRLEMLDVMDTIPRYIACARVTKRQIFEFVSSEIHPNDKVQVFLLPDDYSFGVISSGLHWLWFLEKCTTLGSTPNYNAESIWWTFPWPQAPTNNQIEKVAESAVALRRLRREIMTRHGWSLRDLYRTLETPGTNPLRTAHETLDRTVREAYGMKPTDDILEFLLNLNLTLAAQESNNTPIQPPGLPTSYPTPEKLVTVDCVRVS